MTDDDNPLFRASESEGANRKKTLLRLLACREAERLGIDPSAHELAEVRAEFREMFELQSDAAFEAWLQAAALSRTRFEQLMRGLYLIATLEDHFAADIDREVADQRALWTAHEWARLRRESSA